MQELLLELLLPVSDQELVDVLVLWEVQIGAGNVQYLDDLVDLLPSLLLVSPILGLMSLGATQISGHS